MATVTPLTDLILERIVATGKYGAEAVEEAVDALTLAEIVDALERESGPMATWPAELWAGPSP